MTCQRCRDAHVHTILSERAALFSKAAPGPCGCEHYSVSEYSPGPVADSELLYFVTTDPQWFLEDGRIHPAVLMRADESGLSVLRGEASDSEFTLTMTELQARANSAGKECYFHGTLAFVAADVRYCEYDRFLCVYDTGLQNKPHHADIMRAPLMPKGENWTKSKLKNEKMAMAHEIRKVVGSNLTGPQDFRSGLLGQYAKP